MADGKIRSQNDLSERKQDVKSWKQEVQWEIEIELNL